MRISSKAAGITLAILLAAPALVKAAPGGARPSQPMASATTVLQVNTGRGRLVTLSSPMSDLFVADETIADVQVRSPTQLYIFGKKAGETTVSATTRGGGVAYSSTVRVGNNLDSIDAMLGLAMPEAHIVATPMNGLVLLTGTVAAPEDAAEAERLVQAFVGDTTKVLSRLKTATPLQVNLQVRIAEVSRSFVKNIGVNITNRDGGNFVFGVSQGRAGSITTQPGTLPGQGVPVQVDASGAIPGQTIVKFPPNIGSGLALGAAGRLLGTDLLGSLDLGETIGQVSTLANPNLTALSGETATFLAGGEIPIPISQGLGAISVEYKQYGISLAYTPTVLSDGRISLRVRPEVSQLSSDGAVTISGTTIPALTTRRAETTLELGSGQSMMIGGLLQNSHNNSIDKAPGLGDLPVLGALFRSNSFRRNETELVIVITPYLVKPVNNQSDIALPTDGVRAPTDLGRVFLGEIGGGVSGATRPVPTVAGSSQSAPQIGLAAPLPSARAPDSRDRRTARGKSDSSAAPMPGFSN